MGAKKLSTLQLELLRVYSYDPSEDDLLEIKEMLAKYFADKLVANVNAAIKEKNITNEQLESWLSE